MQFPSKAKEDEDEAGRDDCRRINQRRQRVKFLLPLFLLEIVLFRAKEEKVGKTRLGSFIVF